MQEKRFRPALTLCAALLLAPALSQAVDTATAPSALSAASAAHDDFKEADLWARIRSGYAIPDVDNALVRKHIDWYAARPDYIARTTARASRYLYHVVQELEKRGMPTELALLPVIESAFNPNALSSANAGGMWQFVPGTGKDFGLQQNLFKDERRGVLTSTDAALAYLQKLYNMFGDWQLALAAYNWGEGNVQKAVQKNQAAGKPIDFESLSEHMPAETRNYVPKLQAVKNIVANPERYHVSLSAIENQPYFTAVDKSSDIDVTIAAQLAELSVDEFKALNPQFNRPVITGETKILLPKENAEKFQINLASWGRALSTWTTHKITNAKETITALASKFGTTPEVIRQANNIPARANVRAGSTILVPKTAAQLSADSAQDIVENAVMSLDIGGAKRAAGKEQKLSGAQKFRATVDDIKAQVARTAVKSLTAEAKPVGKRKRAN
ncbi:transglycosylase SLT domain-containing protein [Massilia sp. TS11]|uniref:transglycosylase SLT domain-containing protein n=1 Tax=Massilia sp. TS11 TaxID=2908003 RepID=UPI001EDB9A0E|nr:transglycosylase SLT domain-containing protein [Massilia sp. TS11]MCG2584262.1 transglycosylase SLT domain-containing protein [Massilia sp. TS11]